MTAVKRLPAMMALGIGLSVNNGRAAIEGLVRARRRVRPHPETRLARHGALYASRVPRAAGSGTTPIELVFGLYCTAHAGDRRVITQSWASVPFVTLFSVGFLYVGLTSLVEAFRGVASALRASDAAASQEPVDAFLAEPAVDVELTLRQHLDCFARRGFELLDGSTEADRRRRCARIARRFSHGVRHWPRTQTRPG